VQGNFRLAARSATPSAAQYGATPPDTTNQARLAALPPRTPGTVATLYPNPATGTTLLRFEQPVVGPVQVRVLDFMGLEKTRVAQAKPAASGLRTLALPLHGLPAGPYVVEIQTQGARHTLRLSVQ
jgi:hypothetical protein